MSIEYLWKAIILQLYHAGCRICIFGPGFVLEPCPGATVYYQFTMKNVSVNQIIFTYYLFHKQPLLRSDWFTWTKFPESQTTWITRTWCKKTAWAIAIRHRGTTAWATHKRLHRGGACNVSLTYLEVMQGEAALGLIVAHQVVRTMQSTASQTRGGATTSGDKRERDRQERWTENKICILSWAIKLHDVYSYKHCDVTVCLEAGPCIRRKRQAWYTRGRSYIRHLIP